MLFHANALSRCLALAVLFPASGVAQSNIPALVKRLKPAIVTILCYDSAQHPYGLGTGFFVSPTHIITSRHVVEGAWKAECKWEDGAVAAVEGIVADRESDDLAMLQVQPPKGESIRTLILHMALPKRASRSRSLEHRMD